MESAMPTRLSSTKRAVSFSRSFLVMSGVAALMAFATVGVAAFSLIAYSLPTPVVLFATGLGGLSLLGWRRKRRDLLIKAPDLSGHPRNVGRPNLSTRFETVRYINKIVSSRSQHRTIPVQAIAEALVAEGYTSLDKQAKALGLGRSTAWTIIKKKHKLGRLNAKTTHSILANPDTPASVRAVIRQYEAQNLVIE
jgi:hypothetical protein